MTQIITALSDMFNQPLKVGEKRKIIFWMDQDREFTEEIDKMAIPNVKIHTLTKKNQFYTKFLLEEEDPTSAYLIYTDLDIDSEKSWLKDIALYSQRFYADRVSLILDELAIDTSLRAVIQKYERFYNSKERFRKFKSHQIETYTEEMIELVMMSVLCNIQTPNFEAVLKTVLMDTLENDANKYLSEFKKFFDIHVFWEYVANHYGYDRDERSLKTLFIHLTITAFSHSVDEKYITSVKNFIAEHSKANALLFIDHWMHHKTDFIAFDEYAQMVEQEINLANMMNDVSIEDFIQADIFPFVDRAVIIYIANSLAGDMEDYREYKELISLRKSKHYYEKYQYVYEALLYMVKMHEFHRDHQRIPEGLAIDLYKLYVDKYYQMDTYYRKFYIAYDQDNNHEVLRKLKPQVENLYTNWFMGELSAHWSQAVDNELRDSWSLPGIRSQQDLYGAVIAPRVKSGERIFLIVSDAMRYEVGHELGERLNADTLSDCKMSSLLGVVPSITKLGMASLLPHCSIDIDENGRVYVDGKDTAGLENRKKIIEAEVEDSVAIHFQDMMEMNAVGRREHFRGKKLIYIYHDSIDAMGDKASTEIYTFDAAKRAIDELYELVRIIRDQLSGTNVYITADHGFLYQRDALAESDKLVKEEIDTIESKRRYMLSKEKRDIAGSLNINLSSVIKNDKQLNVYVPNATIRYRMQGTGVNFVHGGASLQEIVVPLLEVTNKRIGQRGTQAIKKVDIKLTNTARKITNSIFHLEFFQTEKIEDKVVPRTVAIYMADEKGTMLSNEEIIIGDRSSDQPVDRTFKVQFILSSISYDRQKDYYLIIKDTDTAHEIERIAFSIDLGIVSDFDF